MKGGIEFGDLEHEVLIIEKTMYGLKSSKAAFRAYLAKKFYKMGFISSVADPNIWMRPAMKSDREEYCRGSSSDTTANKINPYYLIG